MNPGKTTLTVFSAIVCYCITVSVSLALPTQNSNTVVVDGKEIEIVSVPQSSTNAVAVSLDNLLEAKASEAPQAAIPEPGTTEIESSEKPQSITVQGQKVMEVASITPSAPPQITTESAAQTTLNSPSSATLPEIPSTPAQDIVEKVASVPFDEKELKARVDDLLKGAETSIKKAAESAQTRENMTGESRPEKPVIKTTETTNPPESTVQKKPVIVTEKKVEKQEIPIDLTPSKAPEIITEDILLTEKQETLKVNRYPWKRNIQTTVFWVGEPPSANVPKSSCNTMSAWDMNWVRNFGGFDDPNRRNGFFPARFQPKQNPFYIALPFNDMKGGRHKPISQKVIPWFKDEYIARNISVCKGRWLAIRYKGRTCYAQWEDVGPFEHDHPEYVFGKSRPRPNRNKNAGLDISPAARDYLGLDGACYADWKFVEDEEVPAGPWKKIVNIRASIMAKLESQKKRSTNN
ncbi:MAG: hypothetical protein SGI98_04445 [Verrucomicrobiota bacterium]|nr:hypothetical protein [Verrucomicrobiota bacterium]